MSHDTGPALGVLTGIQIAGQGTQSEGCPADIDPPQPLTWHALDALTSALRERGASLRWHVDAFILAGPGGVELARAPRLDELALILGASAGKVPRYPWVQVRLKASLLLMVGRVLGKGESLSAFIRAAMRAEVARRQAADAEGGDHAA